MPGRFPDRPAPDELAALFAAEDLARLRSRRAEYPKRHRHAAGPSTQETPPADETPGALAWYVRGGNLTPCGISWPGSAAAALEPPASACRH